LLPFIAIDKRKSPGSRRGETAFAFEFEVQNLKSERRPARRRARKRAVAPAKRQKAARTDTR
jgi:hypothetical protein